MNLSPEKKALGWAIAAAAAALAGALLIASPIEARMTAGQMVAAAPSAGPSAEMLAKGPQFFGQTCADCHGDDAHGDEGPDLHNLAISNARIATTIKNGVKGEMPSFGKKYDDQQVAALVAYVRSLH